MCVWGGRVCEEGRGVGYVGRGVAPMCLCIMGNGHLGTHPRGQNDGQTPMKTLPSRNYCCGR